MKICPYCAEEIKDAAIKCKHCHSMLDRPPPVRKMPGERSGVDLAVAFFLVGPFMLPMLWSHPTLSKNAKILGTAGVATIFGLLVWLFVWALGRFYAYWGMLDRIYGG